MKQRTLMNHIFLFLLVTTPISSLAAEQKTDAAEQAAIDWLDLVDTAQYEASWREASTLFKHQVSTSDWTKTIIGVRKALGDVITREVISATYKTSLPGAPDGEYVILQFQTAFKNKAHAIETVTPMLDDGQWRVSGYYIK
jgi:hypothetical protein